MFDFNKYNENENFYTFIDGPEIKIHWFVINLYNFVTGKNLDLGQLQNMETVVEIYFFIALIPGLDWSFSNVCTFSGDKM